MKNVIIESPFKGNYALNKAYLFLCIKDSLSRGEAPFASHLFYTEVLDDRNPADRDLGIMAGLAWAKKADYVAVYYDLGISEGMQKGIDSHKTQQIPIKYREIKGFWIG